MALERERRFLVNGTIPIDEDKMMIIKQGYFVAEYDEQLRIRLTYRNDPFRSGELMLLGASMCHKKHINETDRDEKEWDIMHLPLQVIEEMYDTTKWKINKTRALIDRWEVDMIKLPNKKSLVVAEIEYDDNNPFPEELPSWIATEITGLPEYANPVLAKRFSNY